MDQLPNSIVATHERPIHRFAAWIGWRSIRGRYLYAASAFILLLIGAAWVADVRVQHTSLRSDSNTVERNTIRRSLRAITDDLRKMESALHEFLLVPAANDRTRVETQLNNARLEVNRLITASWIDQNENTHVTLKKLIGDLQQLSEEADRLMATRASLGRTALPNVDTVLPLLHDNFRPLLIKLWDGLEALEASVEIRSVEDMSVLAQTADELSGAIWLLVVAGTIVTCIGYLFFEINIRRPLAQVASALKAEADGVATVLLTHGSTEETNDLITAFDRMRHQVHSRQKRLETILDNAAEGIITFDSSGLIERFNKAAERLFGYNEDEIVGKNIELLILPDVGEKRKGYAQHFIRTKMQQLIGQEGEVTGRHKDGSTFAMALKISRIALDGNELYTGLVADISERKAMVEHLKNMAEHDGLTGLYNRTYFQQELERVVERARRSQSSSSAVLYVDLDNFKYVNDTLGHAAGDQLLIEVAGILHKRSRKSDLIARFGGDEFTVLLYDTTPELALSAAESFRKKLANYNFRHEGEQVDIGCSIGVAAIGPDTTSAEEALSHADVACHLAKRNGRNQVHAFVPSDADSVAAMSLDMGWSRRIKEAIEHNHFTLACQPIVNVATGDTDAYEVLIRLLDEAGNLIMPSGFLPSADRFGLSTEIDKWVIKNAIETLRDQRAQLPGLRYSINLSGQTLSNPTVCDLIQQILWETELDPSALTFEVTETVAITDMSTAQTFLSRLREMGCRTALDDFGSGMSSFAYLRDLPVDYVKIDGRFVRNLASNTVDQAIFRAINDVVHAFGKQTVAEFVENERIYEIVKEYGVDYAQGYYLGRPDVTVPCRAIAERLGQTPICHIR